MANSMAFSLDSLTKNSQYDFVKQFISDRNPDPDEQLSNFVDVNDNPYENLNLSTKYMDESEFILSKNNSSNSLFYSLNIQSLPAKFSEFSEHLNALSLNNCSPDIICLQEIWRIQDPSQFSLHDYSELFVKSRFNKQGGGVGLYFKKEVKFKILPQKSVFVDQILETIVAEIILPLGKKAVVASIYRPGTNHPTLSQSDQFTQSMELLANLLNDLSSCYEEMFIFGDFNVDVLKYNTCKMASEYVDLLFSFGLLQTVSKPTRCTYNTATLIDHSIIMPNSYSVENILLVNKISDHFPVLLSLHAPKKRKVEKEFTSRNFSDANVNKFKMALRDFNWNLVTDNNDAQDAFSDFSNVFHNLYKLYFPVVTTKFNKKIHNIEKWMSKGILISRATKIKLGKNCFTHPSISNSNKFKVYRNIYNVVIRNAKKLHYERELRAAQSNLKKLGQFLKML